MLYFSGTLLKCPRCHRPGGSHSAFADPGLFRMLDRGGHDQHTPLACAHPTERRSRPLDTAQAGVAMTSRPSRDVRIRLSAAFMLMGFSFSVAQTLLMREMLVSFAGNGLSIGVILGSWLLLEAAGSGLLTFLASRAPRALRGHSIRGALPCAWLQILLTLLLLPMVALGVCMQHLAGGVPGQGLGLIAVSLASFLLLLPIGLVDSAMFTLACRVDEELPGNGSTAPGRVYVTEALGGIAGGVAFTYLFAARLHSVQIALIVAAPNLSSTLFMVCPPLLEAPVDDECRVQQRCRGRSQRAISEAGEQNSVAPWGRRFWSWMLLPASWSAVSSRWQLAYTGRTIPT